MRLSFRNLGRWRSFVGAAALVPAGIFGALALPPEASTRPSPALRADSIQPDLAPLLGVSGNLRVIDVTPLTALASPAGREPGMHPTGLLAPDGEPIHTLTLVPLVARPGSSWRGYRVGFWPGERTASRRRARYPLPRGFLEVTRENQDLQLSSHFRVRDFLTKDQLDVWPKVLVIQMPLLDKLELIADELEAVGQPATLRVMSGFRTPQYNAGGVGVRGGRARDSRHMYGDAADIYVDGDGDGRMDDLDGDGQVTVRDARWLAAVAARIEDRHPGVRGGIGTYRATRAHGPFVHVDTRGTPARW